VGTVRSEFVDLVERQTELASIQPLKARYSVEAPNNSEIERIVGIPAEAAGLWFGKDPSSGKWVDRQLVEQAEASPDRLWELSYCLQGLYDRRTPRGKVTQTALDELGGVAGALASIAEAKLATLPPAAAAALPRLAKELVHDYEDSGILLPKSVLARYFSKDQDLAPLVDALLQIGLLSRFKPNGGGTLLRLTSIGVVSSWPRFAEAFEASRHMPGFDPSSMGASGDSSCEIDVSGLAASAPAEMAVEDGIVDATSTDFKLPASRPRRSTQLKIAGAVASCLLLAGGWWWGMRPYLFAKSQEGRSVSSVGDTPGEVSGGGSKAPPVAETGNVGEPAAAPAVASTKSPPETGAVAAAPTGIDPASASGGKPEQVPAVAPVPGPMKTDTPNAEVAVASVTPVSPPGDSLAAPSANPVPTPRETPPVEAPIGGKPDPIPTKSVPPDAPSTPAERATAVAAVSKPPPAVPATVADGGTSRLTGTEDQFVNSLAMTLRRIPAGTFEMGSPAGESGRHDNEPRRRITITRTYYMGAHEVTQGQFEELMGRNPSGFKGKGMPVESVSWTDAVEFCRRLSERDAEKGRGVKYRLPTEAEWEYACRAGSAKAFSFGNAAGSRDANFDGTQPYGNGKSGPDLASTIKIGAYPPNAWGLYDMHGNVAEWCGYWFGRTVDLTSTTDPTGAATGTRRVIRGGSWLSAAADCRCAWRGSEAPERFDSILGFRVVAEIP
jgi:formylglycine-generating enzyme required for sulfatase activity